MKFINKKILTIISVITDSKDNIDSLMEFYIDASLTIRNDVEIILVDTGSKDGTYKYAYNFYAHFTEGISLYKVKEERGSGGAVNEALKHATGKYIKILDANDKINTKTFTDFYNFLIANEYDVIVNGQVLHDDETNEERSLAFGKGKDFINIPNGEFFKVEANLKLDLRNLTFKRELLIAHDFIAIENFFFEDLYTTIFVLRHAKSFYSLSDMLILKQGIQFDTKEIMLEKYIKYEHDFWKIITIILTEIDPLNKKTHDWICWEIYRLILFDLSLVWGKNVKPWKDHYNIVMNLINKNVYLSYTYNDSILNKQSGNGKSNGKIGKYAKKVIGDIEQSRML